MLLDIQGDMNAIKNTMNELKKISDEEKINLPKDVYLRNTFCHDCSFKKTCGNDSCESYEFWKEGYEKGLAEGKPKWHDLREKPDDLPKRENKHFSWSMTVSDQDGTACHYNYDKHCWETSFVTEVDVIAWCELPRFEEVKK